jgi:hypothetical protein
MRLWCRSHYSATPRRRCTPECSIHLQRLGHIPTAITKSAVPQASAFVVGAAEDRHRKGGTPDAQSRLDLTDNRSSAAPEQEGIAVRNRDWT